MRRKLECPFCGGEVEIISDSHVAHGLKACKVFDETMGAADFIAKVRTGDVYACAPDRDEEEA